MTQGYGFSYRGKHSDDFGVTAEKTIRPISAALTAVTEQIPNRKGVYYYRTDKGPSIIKVSIVLQTDKLSTFRPDIRAITAWLDPDQGVGPLVFDNEPDKTDEAVFYNNSGQQIDITQLVLLGRMELQFLVPDGESVGADHTQTFTDAGTIRNGGSAEAYPVFTVTFSATSSTFKITNQDGESINIDYSFSSGNTLVIDCQYEKVTINGEITMSAYDWTSSDFFSFVPGDNDLTISPTRVSSVSVDYQERWL